MGTSDTFTSMHFDLFLFCMNYSSKQPLCWVQEYSIAFVPFTPFNKDSFHATATDAFAIELHQQPVSHMLRELQQSAPSLSLSLSPAGINCLSRKLTLFPHRPNSTVPPHIAPIASAYVVVSSKRASIHLASGAYALVVCFSITIALTHSISLTRPMSVCVCVCCAMHSCPLRCSITNAVGCSALAMPGAGISQTQPPDQFVCRYDASNIISLEYRVMLPSLATRA